MKRIRTHAFYFIASIPLRSTMSITTQGILVVGICVISSFGLKPASILKKQSIENLEFVLIKTQIHDSFPKKLELPPYVKRRRPNYDPHPIHRFLTNLARKYNWTLGTTIHASLLDRGPYGFLRQLNKFKMSFGIGYIPHPATFRFTEMSPPYQEVSIAAMGKKKEPDEFSYTKAMSYLLKGIYHDTSYAIGIVTLSIIIVGINFTKGIGYNRSSQKFEHWKSNLQTGLWNFGDSVFLFHSITVLGHQTKDITRKTVLAVKLILFSWLAGSIYSVMNVKTELTSINTAPPYVSTTLSQYFIKPGNETYGGIVGIPLAKLKTWYAKDGKSDSPVLNHLEFVKDAKRCLEKIVSSPSYYICVNFGEFLEYARYTLPKEKGSILELQKWESYDYHYYTHLAFPKGFPFLQEISRHLHAFLQGGIISKYIKEAPVDAGKFSSEGSMKDLDDSIESLSSSHQDDSDESLTKNWKYLILIYSIFYLSALTVFLLEIIMG